MLLKTSDLTGMGVVSVETGKQVGTVADVVVDPKKKVYLRLY